MILIDNFTRIQNMKRIKDIFDALHQFDLGFAKGLMHILLLAKPMPCSPETRPPTLLAWRYKSLKTKSPTGKFFFAQIVAA